MNNEMNGNTQPTDTNAAPTIQLTLDPTGTDVTPIIEPETLDLKTVEKLPEKLDYTTLSPDEQKMVKNFASQININDTNQVLQFGSGAQRNISAFSESALQKVRTQDMGEVGGMLSELVIQLRGFDVDAEKKQGFSLFKKAGNKLATMKAQYSTIEKNVDGIAQVLQNHQIRLLRDIAILDQMYEKNITYYKELTMYILAGKEKLNEVLTNELPALKKKAEESGRPEDAQSVNDLSNMINRFEKKLHDLELTRIVSIQMAPQIRLVQNNDSMMVEKIQSSLVNTIPLWKNQMVLNLGIANSQEALHAQRAVTDMTNELLKKNAETLRIGTIETAKESERAIVDIETLKHTNEQLISTMDEVLRIQEDGRQKRLQAEGEMARLEGELKQKLLELRN